MICPKCGAATILGSCFKCEIQERTELHEKWMKQVNDSFNCIEEANKRADAIIAEMYKHSKEHRQNLVEISLRYFFMKGFFLGSWEPQTTNEQALKVFENALKESKDLYMGEGLHTDMRNDAK